MAVKTLSGNSKGGKITTLNGSSMGGNLRTNSISGSSMGGNLSNYVNGAGEDIEGNGSGSGKAGSGSLSGDGSFSGGYEGSLSGGGYGGVDLSGFLAEQRAAAENAYRNSMARLENAYNQSMGRLNTAWDTNKNMLKSNLDSTLNRLKGQYDYSSGVVNDDANKSLREAYVNYMLNKKNLNQGLSAMGLSGGATESNMAKMYNNYGSSRNNINTQLAKNIADLLNEYQGNVSNANQLYNSQYADAQNQYASQLNALEQNAYNSQTALESALANALANVTTGNNMAGYASYLNALSSLNSNPSFQVSSFNNGNYAQNLANLNNKGEYTPTQNTLALDNVSTTSANNMGSVTDYAKWKAMVDDLANAGASQTDMVKALRNSGASLDEVFRVFNA